MTFCSPGWLWVCFAFWLLQRRTVRPWGKDSRVGKALGSFPVQIPACPEQAATDCIQLGFEHLWDWSLCDLSGQPTAMFDDPHWKKGVSYFEWDFLCFCLYPLFLVLSEDTTVKGLAPALLHAHQVSIHTDRVLLCRPPATWAWFPDHGNGSSWA